MVHQLTEKDFNDFISQREFAVIHFDAPWDVGYRPPMQLIMNKASEDFPEVNFAEVDVDRDGDLARDLPVMNVPTVAYYRYGELVAALIGQQQNIEQRLCRLMRGQTIGYNDGTGVARLRPLNSCLRWF
jgi:thioredoxin-like negative regulator of GroEL